MDEIGVAQFGSGNMKKESYRQGVDGIRRTSMRGHQRRAEPSRPKLSERVVKRVAAWLG